MAKEPGSNKSIDQIKWEIERSREGLVREVRGLRYELDVPAKIRRSFREKPVPWIAVAVVIGIALVALPRGGKTVVIETNGATTGKRKSRLLQTGFLLGALRIAATLAKPVVISFVRERMAGGGGGRVAGSRSRFW
jgi:hypothetical protein